MDKDTLIKHRYWIGFGAAIVLWFGATVALMATAGGAIKKKETAYKTALGNIKKARPMNEHFLKPWNDYGDVFRNQKEGMWGQAWNLQKNMETWPPQGREPWPTYPSDPFSFNLLTKFWKGAYQSQFANLKNLVETSKYWHSLRYQQLPVGQAPVQFQGGFSRVVQQVPWQELPTIEECWLAQENFWVQRELVHVVRDAVTAVSSFKEVSVDPKKEPLDKKKYVGRRRFVNERLGWQLDFLFVAPRPGGPWVISGDSEIKNIHRAGLTQALAHPRTNQALQFRLIQSRGGQPLDFSRAGFTLSVAGEPLVVNQSRKLKRGDNILADPVDPRKPFGVRFLFDPDTSPVRRIDRLVLTARSHRTFTAKLKPSEIYTALDKKSESPTGAPAAPAAPAGPGGGTPMPGGGGAVPMGPGAEGVDYGGGDSSQATQVNNPTTIHQLERDRYVHVTKECRHLPVGMVLLVEQAHIQDVLVAVANSPLRIQVTQVDWHHDSGRSTTGTDYGEASTEEGPARPEEGPGTLPGGRRVRPGTGTPMGVGGLPGEPMGPTGQTRTRGETNTNLVKLSVYGISALYYRPPKKEPKPKTPGQPGMGTPRPQS